MVDQPVSGSAKNDIQFLSDRLYFIFCLQLIKTQIMMQIMDVGHGVYLPLRWDVGNVFWNSVFDRTLCPRTTRPRFLVSQNSKLGFNFSYHFIQGLTHRLVRGPLGATWFEIFGVHLILVRCDPWLLLFDTTRCGRPALVRGSLTLYSSFGKTSFKKIVFFPPDFRQQQYHSHQSGHHLTSSYKLSDNSKFSFSIFFYLVDIFWNLKFFFQFWILG